MTIIAYANGVIASDSLGVYKADNQTDRVYNTIKKLHLSPDSTFVIGQAGTQLLNDKIPLIINAVKKSVLLKHYYDLTTNSRSANDGSGDYLTTIFKLVGQLEDEVLDAQLLSENAIVMFKHSVVLITGTDRSDTPLGERITYVGDDLVHTLGTADTIAKYLLVNNVKMETVIAQCCKQDFYNCGGPLQIYRQSQLKALDMEALTVEFIGLETYNKVRAIFKLPLFGKTKRGKK